MPRATKACSRRSFSSASSARADALVFLRRTAPAGGAGQAIGAYAASAQRHQHLRRGADEARLAAAHGEHGALGEAVSKAVQDGARVEGFRAFDRDTSREHDLAGVAGAQSLPSGPRRCRPRTRGRRRRGRVADRALFLRRSSRLRRSGARRGRRGRVLRMVVSVSSATRAFAVTKRWEPLRVKRTRGRVTRASG